MHEASVALELVSLATQLAQQHGARRVRALGVRLGVVGSVVPQALEFAFPSAAQGSLLEGARLIVERVEAVARCPACGPVALELQRGLRCPQCGQPTPELLAGEELELDWLELED